MVVTLADGAELTVETNAERKFEENITLEKGEEAVAEADDE